MRCWREDSRWMGLLRGGSGELAWGFVVAALHVVHKPCCSSKKKLFVIYGKWTECLWGIDPAAYESFRKQERRGEPPRKAQLVRCCQHLALLGTGPGDQPCPSAGPWEMAYRLRLSGTLGLLASGWQGLLHPAAWRAWVLCPSVYVPS